MDQERAMGQLFVNQTLQGCFLGVAFIAGSEIVRILHRWSCQSSHVADGIVLPPHPGLAGWDAAAR